MEGSFRKRGDKYQLRIMVNGRQRSFTGSTKRECYLKAEEAKHETVEVESMTFKEALELYLEMMEPVLSPSTIVGYKKMQHIKFGDIDGLRISTIESKDLQYMVSRLAKVHSPKYVKNIYALACAVLGKFYPEKKYNVVLPRKEELTYSLPDDAEIQRVLDHSNGSLKIAIMLAAFGTLRRGEICALKFKDINKDLRIVSVNADMVRDPSGAWILKPPKTNSSIRSVQMPKEFFELLQDGAPDDFVCPMTPNALTDKWCRLRDKLGIDVRFHDLRHYAASLMHSLGVPDQYIMEQGGWKSDGTLKAVYRNTLKDKRKEFRRVMADYWSESFDLSAQEAK